METIKKLLALLLSLLLALSFAACGVSDSDIDEILSAIDSAMYEEEVSESYESHAEEVSEESDAEASTETEEPSQSAEESSQAESAAEQIEILSQTESTAEQISAEGNGKNNSSKSKPKKTLNKNGSYTSRDDVALYIHTYKKLPNNFITKSQAQKLGWNGGGLEAIAPGKCIGGSRFGNFEGILPEKEGRYYTECDIDTLGKRSRGQKRIVFSNDGLIYYTDDHYKSFTLLYGEE